MTDFNEEKSRTQVKKEVEELQKLGERLISLSKAQLLSIDIPQELIDTVLLSKSITTNKAKRRQKQYIGALMREIDIDPILKALRNLDDGLPLGNSNSSEVKDLLKKLTDGDDSSIERIVEKYPKADRQKLRQLVRNARKEKLAAKSQKATKNLQHYIREVIAKS